MVLLEESILLIFCEQNLLTLLLCCIFCCLPAPQANLTRFWGVIVRWVSTFNILFFDSTEESSQQGYFQWIYSLRAAGTPEISVQPCLSFSSGKPPNDNSPKSNLQTVVTQHLHMLQARITFHVVQFYCLIIVYATCHVSLNVLTKVKKHNITPRIVSLCLSRL